MNMSIIVHSLPMHVLALLSVDEIFLPKYLSWSTDFRVLPFKEEMAQS